MYGRIDVWMSARYGFMYDWMYGAKTKVQKRKKKFFIYTYLIDISRVSGNSPGKEERKKERKKERGKMAHVENDEIVYICVCLY